MSKYRRQLGENVPRGFAEALGLAMAQRNLVTPPCPDCDRLMFATAELRDLDVQSVDLTASGPAINGYAKESPRWHCEACKATHPVADEDMPRWEAVRRTQHAGAPDA